MTTDKSKNFFRVSAEDFKKIPGSPIAYWAEKLTNCFANNKKFENLAIIRSGLSTGDNDRFMRYWYEVDCSEIAFNFANNQEFEKSAKQYVPCKKGGDFRRWYGDNEYVIKWRLSALFHRPRTTYIDLYYRPAISWSAITSGKFHCRYYGKGFLFDHAAASLFPHNANEMMKYLAYMSTKVFNYALETINPTINTGADVVGRLPVCDSVSDFAGSNAEKCVKSSKNNWDSYETSWDFRENPLCVSPQERAEQLSYGIHSEERAKAVSLISERYMRLRCDWQRQTEEMRNLEIENNRIFIDAYGLQDELSPEVPWNEITLTCNPWYRYGKSPQEISVASDQLSVASNRAVVSDREVNSEQQKTNHWTLATSHSQESMPMDSALEQRLLEDTIKEFISYAVGCMMGRYSPEKPGLIFAGGEFSDQWSVISGQLVRNEEVEKYVREELSRVTGLAEEYGVGDDCVSTDKTSAEGRNICVGKSDAQSSSLNSIQYCRGTSQKLYEGIRELSLDSKGLQCGSGNPTYDLCSPEILDAISNRNGSELMRRGWQDAERIDWQAIHKAVISNQWAVDSNQKKADHCSLATNNSKSDHWPLTTGHFHPDRDGVLPILDEEWFVDDIVTQFKNFVAFIFGKENLTANMDFIEAVLGKDIRKYFVKDFYKEHIQRYKKRPIYWLFSSPKGSFNALIYLHRYTPDTVSIVLNEYLRELMTKISTRIKHLIEENNRADISNADKTRNLKQIDKYTAQLAELEDYERDVIFPLAQQKIAIDLDDGVKVNYCKFGAALKKIPGLEAKEE